MSKLIDAKTKTTTTAKSGSEVDPTNDCCTVPPDGDPGPIKP